MQLNRLRIVVSLGISLCLAAAVMTAIPLIGGWSLGGAEAAGPNVLTNVHSNQCVTVRGASDGVGADIIQRPCGEDGQQFQFEHLGDGFGHLKATHSDLCLTIRNDATWADFPVEQASCLGEPNQQWVPVDAYWSRDTTQFKVRSTGMCLGIRGNSSQADEIFVQEPCTHDGRHRFSTPVGDDMIGKGGPGATMSVPATAHGPKDFNSFFQGTLSYDAWTYDDIAYYSEPGRVPQDVANRWVAWYDRVDELYWQMSQRSDFDSVYRRGTPDFGAKKVMGLVSTCGAGCGSKQQAEADPDYLGRMLEHPDDWYEHWVLFYEMGRGGSPEPFYGRATWPANTVLIPHLMAGVAFHELGGDGGMERGIPGLLLNDLVAWEQGDEQFVDVFADKQSHDLMNAMFYRILQDTDYETIARILRNMESKPKSADAVSAMCDFQSAVNDATGNRYAGRMVHQWRLPANCGFAVPPAPEPAPSTPPTPDPNSPTTTRPPAPPTSVAPPTTAAPTTTEAPATTAPATTTPATTAAPSTTAEPSTSTTADPTASTSTTVTPGGSTTSAPADPTTSTTAAPSTTVAPDDTTSTTVAPPTTTAPGSSTTAAPPTTVAPTPSSTVTTAPPTTTAPVVTTVPAPPTTVPPTTTPPPIDFDLLLLILMWLLNLFGGGGLSGGGLL